MSRTIFRRALVTITNDNAGDPLSFDLTGTSTDGRGRANKVTLSIEGDTAQADGYRDSWKETVAAGASSASIEVDAFYNTDDNEVDSVLWTMYRDTHGIGLADCATPVTYTVTLMPEGDCPDKPKYTLSNVVLENYSVDLPPGDFGTVSTKFSGYTLTRELISGGS